MYKRSQASKADNFMVAKQDFGHTSTTEQHTLKAWFSLKWKEKWSKKKNNLIRIRKIILKEFNSLDISAIKGHMIKKIKRK